MKLKIKNKQLKLGEIRVKTNIFLFFPKIINNEIRWMERASWSEVVMNLTMLVPERNSNRQDIMYLKWVPKEWK